LENPQGEVERKLTLLPLCVLKGKKIFSAKMAAKTLTFMMLQKYGKGTE